MKKASKFVCLTIALLLSVGAVFGQEFTRIQRGRAKDMLNAVKNEIKNNYYDSTFHGVDLEKTAQEAHRKIDEATSQNQAFGVIAQFVMNLNDSHARFQPPLRNIEIEPGYRMQMIGDKCFVTGVKPKSHAAEIGLKPGDQVVKIENNKVSRSEMWKMQYYYGALSPRESLTLTVKSPGATETRDLTINAKVKTKPAFLDTISFIRFIETQNYSRENHRFQQIGGVMVWKMPSFVFEPQQVNDIMKGKIRGSSSLILDLRNNGGGYVVTLEELAGYFTEKDLKIADLKGRKEMKPQRAKTKGKDVYKGNLIVLIDSNSGSAAEIFARLMQLEQRGVVIGDVSAGAVMQSVGRPLQSGDSTVIFYGMNLTNADVIMSDGKSIEHIGVMPQLKLLPTAEDLAAGRDPVLAAAFELLGQKVSPEQVGKLFPYEWENN